MATAERLRVVAAFVILLSGCTGIALPPAPAITPAVQMGNAAAGCRVAANGGPATAGTVVADRGIGGTGAPAAIQTADRGIGGTGIIGVITGFASICLGGQEVGYDAALPILVDGTPASTADLRAGQLALVDANGPEAGLKANRVLIRHEVSGPVQSSFAADATDGPGSRMVRVAGQRVAVAPSTLGDATAPVGAFVAVSGFRDDDGIIRATRIDRQLAGEVRIAGPLLAEGGHLRIGTAEIVPAPGMVLLPGHDVIVAGRWSDGVLYAAAAEPDLLSAEPAAFFGPGIATLVIESYAGVNEGRLVIGRVQRHANGDTVRRSVVELARRPDGALQPASIRDGGPGGPLGRSLPSTSRGRYEPAPLPHSGSPYGDRSGGRNESRGANRGGEERRRGVFGGRTDPDLGGSSPIPAIPGTVGPGTGQGSATGGFGGPPYGGFQGTTGTIPGGGHGH